MGQKTKEICHPETDILTDDADMGETTTAEGETEGETAEGARNATGTTD